ncbi:MAG TPA: class I SAM-dependent methyltransferase [Actinoplanes sp.]|jgi:SAM-dependent methyltransferase|nr:class I SAM-dependent methyltransferase [Actinoplanes sp.]
MTQHRMTDRTEPRLPQGGHGRDGEGREGMPGQHRERSNVFGEAADQYEAVRPGYPDELVTDVLADAGPGPALEVGAGTGKATVAFAAHDIDLTCLEPDARMAGVLSRRVADFPRVSVVGDRFETWPPDRGYGLLYSAQAWHWIDAERRTDLAYAALAPGGLLALYWNAFLVGDVALHAALGEIDKRYWPGGEETAHAWRVEDYPVEFDTFGEEWDELALHGDTRFTDLRSRHYRWTLRYSAADYARFLATTSLYRMLEPGDRTAALTAVTEAIDAGGGEIEITVDTSLATARRG